MKKKELRKAINRFALRLGRLKKEYEEIARKEEVQWKEQLEQNNMIIDTAEKMATLDIRSDNEDASTTEIDATTSDHTIVKRFDKFGMTDK